ncbi:MAG: nickel pincer cofactor biosynthesis protein LarC [Polyangia bacterium]
MSGAERPALTDGAPGSASERLRGATLYIDCFAGIAGDMMLGALLDLGVPEVVVRGELAKLPLPPWELRVRETMKGALRARKVDVIELAGAPHAHPGAPQHAHEHHPDHQHAHEHHGDHHHAHEHHGAPPHAHEHHADRHHEHAHEHHGAPPHAHAPHGDHHSAHEPHAGHAHVHYAQIRRMLEQAGLLPDVLRRSLEMFDRIAQVEAGLHGVAVADVAFHEVGALDSIIDIVGVAAALSWLRPARVVCRSVALGGGTVWSAHGRLPVPAPATLALLTPCGAPVESGGAQVELTTPTGAAILAAHVSAWGAVPPMQVLAVGHGAGTRELPDRPNLLRVFAGREVSEAESARPDRCVVIEANIDDMSPQLFEPLLDGLLQAGARDVWLVPVHMKKGRPGVIVGVLCDPGLRPALTARLLRESTTLGVRSYEVERSILLREHVTVSTPFGAVAVKLGRDPQTGEIWNVAPEYEVCRERARAAGAPLKEVLAAAIAAYHGAYPRGS